MTKSITQLRKNIEKYILKVEFKNAVFKRELKKELISKGLNPSVFTQLVNGNINVTDLKNSELQCIATVYFNHYKQSVNNVKKELSKEFEPKDYFSDMERINYGNLLPIEESEKRMRFENIEKNPSIKGNFIGFVKIETMAKFYLDRNIIYDFESQRQAVYKKVKGISIREPYLNPVSVDDMATEMEKGDFIKNSTITLNIQALEDKNPNVFYDDKTRVLEIEPLIDYDADNTTVVSCSDGYHTLNAAVKYVQKCKENGIEPQGYLIVQFVQFTKERARKFIVEQSKANPIGKVYAESLTPGEYEEIMAEMNRCLDESKNMFYNNIANTNSIKNHANKLISKLELEDILERIDFKVESDLRIKTVVPKLCRIATNIRKEGVEDVFKALSIANKLIDLDLDSEEYVEAALSEVEKQVN